MSHLILQATLPEQGGKPAGKKRDLTGVKEAILEKVGMSEVEYNAVFFEVGMELAYRMCGEEQVHIARQITTEKESRYWKWCRYFYLRNDEVLLERWKERERVPLSHYVEEKNHWVDGQFVGLGMGYMNYAMEH